MLMGTGILGVFLRKYFRTLKASGVAAHIVMEFVKYAIWVLFEQEKSHLKTVSSSKTKTPWHHPRYCKFSDEMLRIKKI